MTALSPAQIAYFAQQAGVPPELLATKTAIALAESSGRPTAFNNNAATGDSSRGLWQINMIGSLGPERRKQFGISSDEELFDPAVNARAAKQVYDSQGLGAWSVYKSGKYKDFLPQAQEGVKQLMGGNVELPPPAARPGAGAAGGTFQSMFQQVLQDPPRTPEAATALAGLGASFAASAGLAPPRPPRMASSVPYLQELASSRGGDTSGINSIDQLAMAAVAALNPGGGTAAPRWSSSSGGGALKVGRVADPKEDVFPTTGAHLDVRVVKPDGQYVNPEAARSLLQNLVVGDKPLFQQQGGDWAASHPITSRFGPRSAPVAGASTYHRGVDFGVSAHTPLEWRGGGKYRFADGYGVIDTPSGYQIKLLHTRPS